MADLFSVKSPLLIRNPRGEVKVIIHCYPHSSGMVFLEPFWNEMDGFAGVHLVEGAISGEGPWKIGDYVITLLGCVNTHGEPALEYEEWRQQQSLPGAEYPGDVEIEEFVSQYLSTLT